MKTALSSLRRLAGNGASGEFVCVGGACELHVFLQAGRVAWATDASAPFAFARHLIEHTTLTNDTFQEVLESCRRDRLPLGETLIAWQLATLEEIRAALSHQVRGALATLATCHDASSVFLERARQYASYDVRLTFTLDEVLPAPPRRSDVDLAEILRRLAGEVAGASRLELLAGSRSLERYAGDAESDVMPALCDASIADGAEMAFVRTARATYVGTAVAAPDYSLWCCLEPEAAFGTALQTLRGAVDWSAVFAESPPADLVAASGVRPAPLREISAEGNVQLTGASSLAASVAEFLAGVPDVIGVLVDIDGSKAAAVRSGWEIAWLRDLARRRSRLFGVSSALEGGESALESLGYRLRSVATAEPHVWCFGAELGGTPARTAWMFLERSCSHALGWAYLASLSRQVGGTPTAHHGEGWDKVS